MFTVWDLIKAFFTPLMWKADRRFAHHFDPACRCTFCEAKHRENCKVNR